VECGCDRTASEIAYLQTPFGGLADDIAFDVVEPADPVERVLRDRRTGRFPDIVEVAAQMCPARSLADPNRAIGLWCVERLEPPVGVSLQDTAEVLEVLLRMLALVVRREVIGDCRGIGSAPWAPCSGRSSRR